MRQVGNFKISGTVMHVAAARYRAKMEMASPWYGIRQQNTSPPRITSGSQMVAVFKSAQRRAGRQAGRSSGTLVAWRCGAVYAACAHVSPATSSSVRRIFWRCSAVCVTLAGMPSYRSQSTGEVKRSKPCVAVMECLQVASERLYHCILPVGIVAQPIK